MFWFALQKTREDAWDCGSYDLHTALDMLKEQGHGLVAVINTDTNFCVREISFEEVFE